MISDKQNHIWFVHDVCGIICCVFSWILIAYAQYSVVTCLILPEPDAVYKTINFIIFEILLFLATVAHLKCVFTDPGSIPRGSATREAIASLGLSEDSIIFKCQKCCAIKPDQAHHCSVCRRCILRMDHHCPWINNCVGSKNQKYFILFTLYIALVSTFTLVIAVFHLINCIKNDWSYCDSKPLFSVLYSDHHKPVDSKSNNHASPYSIILIIVLIFESLLFAIFTMIMFAVQIQAIYNDETRIESLKKEKYNNRTKKRSFIKRFRIILSGFNLNWLNPFTSPVFTNSLDFKNYTHYV